jgi:Asp-tRNA(Asn)/Glu-tRNA(Gln) amidotransferase A subunit family amidase
LPASARADIVRAGLAWVKTHVSSPEFKAAYKEHRDGQKPQPPEPVPSAEEQIAKMKAGVKAGIENMRQIAASGDAEMKKAMEESIKQMRAQMENLDKPEMKENLRMGVEMQRTQNKNDYELALKTWNENLPEDPRGLIANRIRQFLETSADVDFSAELTSRGNKMVFVKEDYEQKSAYWKTCFRAGREATEAARAFAKAWLEELK